MSKKKSILLLIILFSCICGSAEAKTIYVDASASSCGDGLSWVTAYKYLQDALEDANASPDCNIYVAEGTYNPDQNCANPGGTGDRMATFQLINDVAIYGGFPTGGCAWNDRNWDMNETILSGDLLGNDVVVADPCELLNDPCRAENSYHVVTGSNTDETAILDGFTITAGNANDPNYSVAGGGMYNDSGSPTVKNCTFKRNSAHGGYDGHSYQGGGGMYNYYHNIYERGPTITDCKFIENWSECGGGMCNNYYSEPTLTNCVFTGNSAEDGGGMSNHYRDPTLTNCTFTDNSAVDNGGGIYNGSSEPTLTNCILWDNSPEQIAGYGTATVTYSDVEGGWCGVGNIDEDPMLEPDGYHLTEGSPCIEAGDPYYVAGPDETDIDGEDRIMYGSYDFKVAIDMGADEFYLSDYFVLEDFERYADSSSLKQVWHGTGGADVNISTGLCDRIVPYQRHTGEKAMAFDYNNALPPYYSEAYANTTGLNSLDFRSDWVTGVNTLSLWFHGIEDLRGNHSATEPYDVNGDGLGIYNTTCDSFYYFYREKTGQITGLVTARVDSIEDTDPLAMAGVMMRDKLTDNCKYAATVVTPDDRLIFMYRDSTTGRALASLSGISMPHWVGIACAPPYPARTIATHANDVDGHPDKWTQIGNDVYGGLGSAPLYLGLCVTSNSYGDMCKAKFAQVDVNSPITSRIGDPDSQIDIGNYVLNDPQPMYVTLQDINDVNWTEYYKGKDPTVTQTGEWTEWRLDLNDFNDNGVDPCYIKTMYIGIGDKDDPGTGSGTMFFDDIGIYKAEFYEPNCPPLPADLARDGEVNYKDLKMITDNWLISNYMVQPNEPDTGPVCRYQLNDDSAVNTGSTIGQHNGTEMGGPTYTTDCMEGDYAIDLDGFDDYVLTDANATVLGIDGNNARTITAWAKTRTFGNDQFRGLYEIGGSEEDGQDFSMLTSGDEPNVWRANSEGGPEDWDIDFEYPSLNEWVHLAHTYDGTTVKVYADGCAIVEAERVLDLNTADAKTFSIGRWSSYEPVEYFDGLVDDVRIYSYALTQEQAAYIARSPDANAFTQPLELLLTPHDPDIDLYDDGTINFKDFAVMAEHWGDEPQVWPAW